MKCNPGKRAEVSDGSGLKVTEEEDGVLVRKPREEEEEEADPWEMISFQSSSRNISLQCQPDNPLFVLEIT